MVINDVGTTNNDNGNEDHNTSLALSKLVRQMQSQNRVKMAHITYTGYFSWVIEGGDLSRWSKAFQVEAALEQEDPPLCTKKVPALRDGNVTVQYHVVYVELFNYLLSRSRRLLKMCVNVYDEC